jgi:hypothetical protein
MARFAIKLRGILLVLLVCLFLSACKSKVTQANFDKVALGMSMKEVEAILGEGTKQSDGAGIPTQFGVALQGVNTRDERYLWESGDRSITVTFRDDKVVHKEPKNLR